jgi:hypothetical protein
MPTSSLFICVSDFDSRDALGNPKYANNAGLGEPLLQNITLTICSIPNELPIIISCYLEYKDFVFFEINLLTIYESHWRG